MVIVGEREAETGMISVRHRQRGDLGGTTLEPFCQQLLQEIAERR